MIAPTELYRTRLEAPVTLHEHDRSLLQGLQCRAGHSQRCRSARERDIACDIQSGRPCAIGVLNQHASAHRLVGASTKRSDVDDLPYRADTAIAVPDANFLTQVDPSDVARKHGQLCPHRRQISDGEQRFIAGAFPGFALTRRHDSTERCDDRIGLQALVALDGREGFALPDRITNALGDRADRAWKARGDFSNPLGVGRDHAVERQTLSNQPRSCLGETQLGATDLRWQSARHARMSIASDPHARLVPTPLRTRARRARLLERRPRLVGSGCSFEQALKPIRANEMATVEKTFFMAALLQRAPS